MEGFFTYAGQIIGGILAFAALWKDASDYGELSKRWGRWLVGSLAALLLVLLLASLYLTHTGRSHAAQDKVDAKNAADVSRAQNGMLSDQIKQMAQERATADAGFRDSFAALSQKVANLQTKSATLELTKQLNETKEDLRQAELKLVQPKSTVIPSLWTKQESQIPVKVASVRLVNNAVAIDFFAFNTSDTPSGDGSILIRRCIGCRFLQEPEGFTPIRGSDADREHTFGQIYPHAGIQKFTAEIVPPSDSSQIEFDIIVQCRNCTPQTMQHFLVNVLRF